MYTTDEMWIECSVDKPNFIRINKRNYRLKKMILEEYINQSPTDGFPGKQTIDSIMESTTIDSVKKVEMLNDELGLSYDQIKRIILEKNK